MLTQTDRQTETDRQAGTHALTQTQRALFSSQAAWQGLAQVTWLSRLSWCHNPGTHLCQTTSGAGTRPQLQTFWVTQGWRALSPPLYINPIGHMTDPGDADNQSSEGRWSSDAGRGTYELYPRNLDCLEKQTWARILTSKNMSAVTWESLQVEWNKITEKHRYKGLTINPTKVKQNKQKTKLSFYTPRKHQNYTTEGPEQKTVCYRRYCLFLLKWFDIFLILGVFIWTGNDLKFELLSWKMYC